MHVAVVDIHRTALRHNLQRVRQLAQDHPVMVMLKANAYGHGLLQTAETLASADAFGVARLHEAISLRQAGFTQRIVLLEGFFEASELALLAEWQLESVLHQQWQLDALVNQPLSQPIRVWIKVDTGMHRLGFAPEQLPAVMAQLQACSSVQPQLQLMSHFACADDLQSSMTAQQLDCFHRVQHYFQQQCPTGELSLANSAGIVAHPHSHLGWVRPGIMLYGANPLQQGSAATHHLQVTMTLRSKIIAVRDLPAHEPIGYGGTWQSAVATRLAVVAMGYGDGYPRHAPSGTPVFIRGQRYPLVGRVSMDMLMVHIGEAEIAVGDEVELWGPHVSVDEIAQAAGTISYELFCGLTKRVHFNYI